MFIGEYHHNIDEKGRITLPAKMRDGLGSEFIVTRGIDKCLFVYPMDEWDELVDKLKELPITKKDYRQFSRMFLSGACLINLDKMGRVNISNPLINYASLKKECVIIGVSNRLEIWALDEWNNFFNDNINDFSDIAEKLEIDL